MWPNVVEELYFFVKVSALRAITLLNNVNEICPYFLHFSHILVNNCIEGVYKNLWSECSFFENWVVEGFPLFLMKFMTIGLHIYCCVAFMNSLKISSGKPSFSYGHKLHYIYAWTQWHLHEKCVCSPICVPPSDGKIYDYVACAFKHIYSISCTAASPPPQKCRCDDRWIDPCRTEMALAFWVQYKINSNFSSWYIMR